MIDTKQAAHRNLRFASIDDAIAEVDRILASEAAGRLRRTGNWTAGQIFGHLATWIEFGYVGYPMRVSWFGRLMARLMRGSFVRRGLPKGFRISGAPAGTYGVEDMSAAEGARRFKALLERLRNEPAKFPSPAFGPMPRESEIGLALRHAELHMGYLHPQ